MGDDSTEASKAGFFKATIWSTVLKAKDGQEEQVRLAAMERLLNRYRKPILRHIHECLPPHRRTAEHAEDLTQEFIHQCLRLDFLKQVNPEQGRFRTFIKVCVRNFLRDQHVRETAEKRGSGQVPVSLDQTGDDGSPLLDPAAKGDLPGLQMDREWALSVVDAALEQLEQDCLSAQRSELFAALKGYLGRTPGADTAKEIGARLGMSEGAVHTAMNRLRGRLGELISAEVRQTVGAEADWRDELKYLIQLVGQGQDLP